MTWTVHVDRSVCMGSGMCVLYAAGYFDIDEEARAVFSKPSDASIDDVRTALEACPTGALSLVEDGEE